MNHTRKPSRCFWVNLRNPVYVQYHDTEWGKPCHDDAKLYELLLLESFQAGLSWECILNKREAFREAFSGFEARAVAAYGESDIERLMRNPAIVRNRRKIAAAIANSRVYLAIQSEWQSFDRYLWHFTDGKTVQESCAAYTHSPLSDAISADLKARGMTFVGTTIVYSYLQAVGVVNGHTPECEWHGSI